MTAAIPEEFFKFAVIIWFCIKNSAFDEPMDGVVYGVVASLGFATLENVLYVIEGSYSVAITRAILSVPAHMLFGVSMGYYLSLSKFGGTQRIRNRYMALSLIVPILLHGAYDYILMSHIPYLLLTFIPFVIWMWIFNMKKLKIYYNNAKLNSINSSNTFSDYTN
jgi:RsiW-degrading membrane proteinase PrsW (M82 family)